ncbi:MAG: phosphoenolpyruvate--protein phosphotransferase [Candidatus Hydrogenedentota bacterium]
MKLSRDKKETRLKGLPVSGGVAMARVFLVRNGDDARMPHYTISDAEVPAEQARLQRALEVAAQVYDAVVARAEQKMGAQHAGIFTAQKLMVEDAGLQSEMAQTIASEHINAETAVDKVLRAYEALLCAVDNDYIRDRSSDVAEVRHRILRVLLNEEAAQDVVLVDHTFRLGEKRIIVADELSPGLTVGLDTSHTVGFITERGGRASHSAILARALGIPAVSGLPGIQRQIGHGEEVLINGDTGEVTLWPSTHTLRLHPALTLYEAPPHASVPVPGIQVMANINMAADTDAANAMQADGIGLYRTEYEFLAAGRVLTEDEQYARYKQVHDAMAGRPVFYRVLDLGGDKSGNFLDVQPEDNPVLGFRGARLLEARPELLISQARALAWLSREGPVNVMYPMIATYEQFLRLRELVVQYTADIAGAQLVHGVMFEVPSAVLDAERIFRVAEFGSVGSNDLTQYLFAVDRSNERVARDFQTDQPPFWRALEVVAGAARAAARPLALCGEIASHADALPRLVALGIRQISVSARLIGAVRAAARQAGLGE